MVEGEEQALEAGARALARSKARVRRSPRQPDGLCSAEAFAQGERAGHAVHQSKVDDAKGTRG